MCIRDSIWYGDNSKINAIGTSSNLSDIQAIGATGQIAIINNVAASLAAINGVNSNSTNKIQIAKIELVGNKWIELGKSNNGFCVDDSSILDEESCIESNYIWNDDQWIEDEDFGASVANTEDDGWYSSPSDVIVEEDKVYNIKSKEQALVLDFNNSGISPLSTLAIKRSFESLSNDKKNSFFIYDKLKKLVRDFFWLEN